MSQQVPKEAHIGQPAVVNLTMEQGATIDDVTITCTTGNPAVAVDWTGFTFVCQIKKTMTQTNNPALATITVTGGADGILHLNSTDVADLKAGAYQYDILGINGDSQRFYFEGTFTVKPRVTVQA